jgi:hypothetical protein
VAQTGTGIKRSARQILLDAVHVVVGSDSDVARYLVKAINSDDPLDLLLAQAAFDELEGQLKRAVAREIETGSRAYRERLKAA